MEERPGITFSALPNLIYVTQTLRRAIADVFSVLRGYRLVCFTPELAPEHPAPYARARILWVIPYHRRRSIAFIVYQMGTESYGDQAIEPDGLDVRIR